MALSLLPAPQRVMPKLKQYPKLKQFLQVSWPETSLHPRQTLFSQCCDAHLRQWRAAHKTISEAERPICNNNKNNNIYNTTQRPLATQRTWAAQQDNLPRPSQQPTRGRLLFKLRLPFLPPLQKFSQSGQALWDQLRSGTIHTRPAVALSKDQALNRLQALMSGLWAATTLQGRRQLIERCYQWCKVWKLPVTDDSAVLWVLSIPNLEPQGALQYIKDLSGTFKALGWPRQELLSTAAALRAQGAALPIQQALPIPRDTYVFWVESLPPGLLQLSAMIAWKTASRWGDVVTLTKDSFILLTVDEVIVKWGDCIKGRKENPYRTSMFTVIKGRWTQQIADLAQALPNSDVPFCPWTTDVLDRKWKEVPALHAYTAHSIKRGAATFLVDEIASKGLVIEPQMISVLLKHELSYELLATTTLRYTSNAVSVARLLKTGDLTVLL
jgi:hypothetical protein